MFWSDCKNNNYLSLSPTSVIYLHAQLSALSHPFSNVSWELFKVPPTLISRGLINPHWSPTDLSGHWIRKVEWKMRLWGVLTPTLSHTHSLSHTYTLLVFHMHRSTLPSTHAISWMLLGSHLSSKASWAGKIQAGDLNADHFGSVKSRTSGSCKHQTVHALLMSQSFYRVKRLAKGL